MNYSKYAGITEFKDTLAFIESRLDELVKSWGTKRFDELYRNDIGEIRRRLEVAIPNLRKILRSI